MQDQQLEIKVTRINNRYHARLINATTQEVLDEMACQLRRDVGWISREMLRWYSKLGGQSQFAEAARDRQNNSTIPVGKTWTRLQLEEESKHRHSTTCT